MPDLVLPSDRRGLVITNESLYEEEIQTSLTESAWDGCVFVKTEIVAGDIKEFSARHAFFFKCYFDLDVVDSTFFGTVFSSCDWEGSFLSCDFQNTKIINPRIDRFVSFHLKFKGCDFRNADFSKARWQLTKFIECDFRGLIPSTLLGTFQEAHLEGCDLRGAMMDGQKFGSDRAGDKSTKNCDFTGASLVLSNFVNVDAERSKFDHADMRMIQFEGAKLTHCTLCDSHLNRASLKNSHIHEARFCRANLRHADLSYAHGDYSNFYEANLEGATFKKAQLVGGDFRGANLKGTRFLEANLRDTRFEGAVNIDKAHFDNAITRFSDLEQYRDGGWE
tara:strand:- start:1987 stop:2991 length:1005 start_codon:yes stop_codon:yes gene_type:complete